MKFFSVACILGLLSGPLLSESGARKVFAPADTTIVPFIPLIPDSLLKDSLTILIHPEQLPSFQYRMGILMCPDPTKVELNPGGIMKVDPSVDVGMIYPFEARQKALLHEKDKNKLPGQPELRLQLNPEQKKKQENK